MTCTTASTKGMCLISSKMIRPLAAAAVGAVTMAQAASTLDQAEETPALVGVEMAAGAGEIDENPCNSWDESAFKSGL
jgi:uncharacterized membrane protein